MASDNRNREFIARYALIHIKGVGPVLADKLLRHFSDAESIYSKSKSELKEVLNQSAIINQIIEKKHFQEAENELHWMEKNDVNFVFPTEKDYPDLLKNTADYPQILYYKGLPLWNENYNTALVGTRKATSYGLKNTREIIRSLSEFGCSILSGLALGIDSEAHKTAITNNLTNFAILAHGLNRIYPEQNKALAKKIIDNGALITEYSSQDEFKKENFLQRNRIIAGMSHTTVIIQSKFGGGAMTTARYAFNCDRELYAVPGRTNDELSQGCNFLIKNMQAKLLLHPEEVYQWFGESSPKQKELFIELTDEQQIIFDKIKEAEKIQIDDLAYEIGKPTFYLMPILLELEFKEVLQPLPGKFYSIR